MHVLRITRTILLTSDNNMNSADSRRRLVINYSSARLARTDDDL